MRFIQPGLHLLAALDTGAKCRTGRAETSGMLGSTAPSCRKNEAAMLYVDHLLIPFGRMLMPHLVADTPKPVPQRLEP